MSPARSPEERPGARATQVEAASKAPAIAAAASVPEGERRTIAVGAGPPGCLVHLTRVEAVTLAGLAAACAGTVAAAGGWLTMAAGLMALALMADMLDGWLARRTTGGTAFGRQLDGEVDAFIYLVLPAAILYQLGLRDALSLLVLFAVVAAGVLRLAHFALAGFAEVDGAPAYGGMPVFWLHLVVALALPAWAVLGPAAAHPLRAALDACAALMLWDRPFPKPRPTPALGALILGVAAAYLGLAAAGIAGP